MLPRVKTALAALTVLLAAAGMVAAIAFAIGRAHDAVPGRLRRCAERSGAVAVTTRESLGAARPDVLAGTRLPSRSWRVGDDSAVLLQGADYAVLVVRSDANPRLGRDPLEPVYRDPSAWALVAVERDPLRGVLAACVRRDAAHAR
jgi:hypothetical protein